MYNSDYIALRNFKILPRHWKEWNVENRANQAKSSSSKADLRIAKG